MKRVTNEMLVTRSLDIRSSAQCVEWHLRCSLLATTLGSSAEEDASRLASKALLPPESTSCIEERLHLCCHHSKSCWKPEEDSISLCKFLRCDDWHIRLRGCAHLSKHFLRESFRNLKMQELKVLSAIHVQICIHELLKHSKHLMY